MNATPPIHLFVGLENVNEIKVFRRRNFSDSIDRITYIGYGYFGGLFKLY